MQKSECRESHTIHVDLDAHSAASKVQDLLNLSKAEAEIFLRELLLTSEDPILALKINPAWVANRGAGADTTVLDEIATFNMPNGKRRDEQSPGFLYYFETSFEVYKCKASVQANHPTAFALSPDAIAFIGAAAADLVPEAKREPLAFTALIHKMAVRQDDVQQFQFFYT